MASLKDRVQRIAKGEIPRRLGLLTDDQPRLTNTRLDEIDVDPQQPRKDLGDLSGLQNSIQEHGILQPLVISPQDDGRFRLIAGERRFTAAKSLFLITVPTIVRTVDEQQRLELQIIENLHRKDLNPLEEAQSYQRLMVEFNLTQDQVAQRVGKSKAAINQTLRILDLPPLIKKDILTSDPVSKSVLLEIAKQPSPTQQAILWEQARRGELTVKQARAQKKPSGGTPAVLSGAVSGVPRPTMTFRYPINLDHVVITLAFERPSASQDEIIEALEEALATEKARLL